MNSNLPDSTVREFLKGLSPHDFLRIGMDEIAYVRTIPLEENEKTAFAIYAADGTQLSVLDSYDLAMATLKHNDLVPVKLH